METIKLQHLPDDRYVTDAFITQDEWLQILKEADRQKRYKQLDTLMMFFRMPNHKSYCSEIAREYSTTLTAVNSTVTHFARFALKQIDNRVRVEQAEGEKDTFWPIVMLGREFKYEHFEWQLRPELIAALREFLLDKLLAKYRERIIEGGLDNKYSDELYKWKILSSCQGKSDLEILKVMGSSSNEMNLLNWRTKESIRKMIAAHPEETIQVFNLLRREGHSFAENFTAFKKASDSLCSNGIINHVHNDRTAALYLACHNPQQDTIYKYEIYSLLCKYLGYSPKGDEGNYEHYLQLLEPIIERETADSELIAKLRSETEPYIWSDRLNAQDVLWQMKEYMEASFPKNWLQRTYDEAISSGAWVYEGWYPEYEKSVTRFMDMFGDGVKSDDISPETLDYYIRAVENYISSNGQGCYTYDEYNKIIKFWPEIYAILKKDFDAGEIQRNDYDAVNHIIEPLLSKRRPAAFHRLWAGIFPEKLTTVITDNRFRNVYDRIRQVDDSLSAPTGHWLEDNITLMDYFKSKVVFQKPWHRALFAWYLHETLNVNENNPDMEKYIKLLESNYNLVLTGAPGTGKTYLAKEIARQITDGEESHIKLVQFHPSYDYTDFVEGLRPDADTGGFFREDGVFKKFCAAALSSVQSDNFDEAYEKLAADLMENYDNEHPMILMSSGGAQFGISLNNKRSLSLHTGKNLQINGSLTKDNLASQLGGDNVFKWWVGYFKGVENLLVSKYGLNLNTKIGNDKYVFIIDEINRGELSKIFGELFFSIDPGYRGEKGRVDTQYQNLVEQGDPFYGGFYVPENVYIIGTMNDIDRSVESMDFAVRRRFAWYEVKATERVSMLEDNLPEQAEAAMKSMKALNAAINDPKIGLTSAYEIGPAYYLKLEKYDGDFEALWTYHIRGLLLEYMRGTRDAETKVDTVLKEAFDTYKS